MAQTHCWIHRCAPARAAGLAPHSAAPELLSPVVSCLRRSRATRTETVRGFNTDTWNHVESRKACCNMLHTCSEHFKTSFFYRVFSLFFRRHQSAPVKLFVETRRTMQKLVFWFPTCQVSVVRFYHSCSSSASAASSSSFLLPPSSFLLASFLANLLRRSCLASSGSQCAPLDLNRKDPLAVCTPGPQPQGSCASLDLTTARIRSQCARLDLNRKDPIAVCTAGPQPQGSDRSVHRGPQPQGSDRSVHPWTSTARIRSQCAPLDLNRKDPIAVCTAGPQPDSLPDRMPSRLPDSMPNSVSDRLLDTLPDRMPENMPDRMPDKMPDRMPDSMPDSMSDRLPDRMAD